jgi:hypothetical protein
MRLKGSGLHTAPEAKIKISDSEEEEIRLTRHIIVNPCPVKILIGKYVHENFPM